jgi:hypothetical protein
LNWFSMTINQFKINYYKLFLTHWGKSPKQITTYIQNQHLHCDIFVPWYFLIVMNLIVKYKSLIKN